MSKPKTRKSKVIVMDCTTSISHHGSKKFRVVKTVNRLDPAIDETLTAVDLEHLIDTEPDCTVEVVPFKRKR